jgi:hypothetical protein
MHWNGTRWSRYLNPPGFLTGVAATSPTDAWAVGSVGAQTLAEHWNGHTWSRWASPNLSGPGTGSWSSAFNSVTVISANNAWAVGSITTPSVPGRTLTAFWNGRHWRLVPSPNPVPGSALQSVTASWTHNIWAVGITDTGALIMHWNGVRWKVMPASMMPHVNNFYRLYGVAAVARDNIWAAGVAQETTAFIIHWNGRAWS